MLAISKHFLRARIHGETARLARLARLVQPSWLKSWFNGAS
jgi:hypothetical protein